MREKFLDLQTQNSSKQHGGVALAARVEKKAGKKCVSLNAKTLIPVRRRRVT